MLNILIVGHSHIEALRSAWSHQCLEKKIISNTVRFLSLRDARYSKVDSKGNKIDPTRPKDINLSLLSEDFKKKLNDVDYVIFSFTGSEHNAFGMFVKSTSSFKDIACLVKSVVSEKHKEWFDFFLPLCDSQLVKCILLTPPPIESEDLISSSVYGKRFLNKGYVIRDSEERKAMWQCQCQTLCDIAKAYGLHFIDLPENVFSESGFIAKDCIGRDPIHGNVNYGFHVMRQIFNSLIINCADTCSNIGVAGAVRTNPYSSLPSYAYWHQSVSQVAGDALDPVVSPRFIIKRKHKVATAGSCFAQHISKRLKTSGFNYFVAEKPDTDSSTEVYDFSARYGNVYTARQLVQLFDRAFGYFNPLDKVWPHTKSGAYCDPFRPRIDPNGFADEQAVLLDRKKHLSSVRRMFKQLDVFVFTLGLTECWLSRLDGAAYPVAPGVVGGVFDSSKYEFVNFGVQDVVTDLNLFIHKLKLVNPKAKIILTVSPVPLVATQEQQHVLVATTYSKSVLRVAADEVARIHDHVQYFPSYEIITGPHASGRYFASDLRSVTEDGVDHVMRVFMSRMTEQSLSDIERPVLQESEKQFAEMEALAEAACDEEVYRQK